MARRSHLLASLFLVPIGLCLAHCSGGAVLIGDNAYKLKRNADGTSTGDAGFLFNPKLYSPDSNPLVEQVPVEGVLKPSPS